MTLERLISPIPSDEAKWHAMRAQCVGASEVAILFGVGRPYHEGIYSLWQVKAGRVPPKRVDGARPKWGLLLEEAIASACAEQQGWHVRTGCYARIGGLGATLDRRIAGPLVDDLEDLGDDIEGPGALETKNTDSLVFRDQWRDGEPPAHVLLQLQAQLLATGYGWGAIAALVGGNDLRIYRYRARPIIQEAIMQRVNDFWESIEANKPPVPDGSDATYHAIAALNPEPLDEALDLSSDNETPILCAEYLNHAAVEKAAKAAKDTARNCLMAKLGAHQRAMVPGFRLSFSVTPERPARMANPGEIIAGRRESRTIHVKEVARS